MVYKIDRMIKKMVFVFVLMFGVVTQQIMAQQVVSTEDFEINLPEGWTYLCNDNEGIIKHVFNKDSLSYTINIFPIPIYTHTAFIDYRPSGTDYIEPDKEQTIGLKDGTELKYKKLQGNILNPNASGCVYVTNRNDKTIIIQEINKGHLQDAKENILHKLHWSVIVSLPFSERVDRFCNVLNGIMKKVAPSLGICLKQSVKDKIFYKEQWLQNSKDEAKALAEGKLQKKDKGILEYFNFSPLVLEMGNEGYSFQESRYLMNGKLESSIVYKPEDYKHLLVEYTEMMRNKNRK